LVRKKLLLLVLTAVIAAAPDLSSIAFANSGCGGVELKQGSCVTGQFNGGGVDLSGHDSQPGSGGGSSGHSKGGGTHKPTPPVCQGLPEACQTFTVIPPGAPGNPSVTINDLKNFPAAPGTDHMEPSGWMVVGLPTNFYSVVGVQSVNGTLLGKSATVRFTPVSWHWTYGDGAAATHPTPGGTWAAQGIREFDPTPTSHTYVGAGTYFIDLSITFTADYRFANGNWTPVFGALTLPANRLVATAGGAKTVLVNHDCGENPGGPGC
jgi:hypothetical protein